MVALHSDLSPALATDPSIGAVDSVLEMLPVAAYVCDASGQLVRFNYKAVEFWGRTPRRGDPMDRFCGSHRLYWPDGRPLPHAETPMADALRTGSSVRDLEVVMERPDGTRFVATVNIEPIRDEQGEIVGAINCFQEMSPVRRGADSFLADQPVFRTVVEATPECVKIVARDGTLLHINPVGLRLIEADALDDVQGRCIYDVIAPEHRADWIEQHERICAGERATWEFDIIGLKGTRRHMESHAVPLSLPDGTVVHLAVTRDVTLRRQQDELMRQSEQALRNILDALPAAIYTTDARGWVTFHNKAAVGLWGWNPSAGSARWCGSWRLYYPDGTPMDHHECPMATALTEGRPIMNGEAIAERPDGTRVPFLAFPTPLRDSSGAMTGAVNMLIDVTHLKEAEARQRLLINELNHRVKNTLATVQSIALQSFRHRSDASARQWFEGRLMALSAAHDVLTRGSWEGAGIREIVELAVAPLRGNGASRFEINGPDIRLVPKVALALAMAVHELCTNAAKYGALSVEGGRVVIDWKQGSVEGEDRLRIRWAEHGGPPVKPPTATGFGTRLIQQGLARELNAEVRLDYSPGGVVCEVDVPLPKLRTH